MFTRRHFIKATSFAGGALALATTTPCGAEFSTSGSKLLPKDLPKGSAPPALPLPHFPNRLSAFIWRNWPLVPTRRIADVLGTTPREILKLGAEMGLDKAPRISQEQLRRSYITIIRRNWHLLPYEQLLKLLEWTPEQMAFTLREDDFLYVKLGNLKPACAPLKFEPPDESTLDRAREIRRILNEEFQGKLPNPTDPLFGFVAQLSSRPKTKAIASPGTPAFNPRFCYSYFALYGDPLLESEADPYPDGYLERLAASGVNGVWLQAVLHKLALFPWDPAQSEFHQQRLSNLRKLVSRARKHGIQLFLYLNEPRAMPLSFFQEHPELKGVTEGDYATLCTSVPEVRQFLTRSVAAIARAVPDLGGFFSISASENLTNCWSHFQGAKCPRCGKRKPGEVIAEVIGCFAEGIKESGSQARIIAWDWGWSNDWALDAINRLPEEATLMSVSEWDLPIQRGGVASAVGEYSISSIGPGPRAKRHWEAARKRGLKTIAKIQAGNTWELSAVPYIPAVENVARHATNLRQAGVDGLMLGWTLGGYPSPNLEVVAEISAAAVPDPAQALSAVARRRFGETLGPLVVKAWQAFSAAFKEFPYHGGVVYQAPLQAGPSNLLWGEPTRYAATMVGIPYDDLNGWRGIYPADIFIAQLEKVAGGFETALVELKTAGEPNLTSAQKKALADEINVAEAAAIHFQSVANQARFTGARNALSTAKEATTAGPLLEQLERALQAELKLARRLYAIQARDSRIGFEATNHYYYVPLDLAEKVLNCKDLLTRWLPAQRNKFSK